VRGVADEERRAHPVPVGDPAVDTEQWRPGPVQAIPGLDAPVSNVDEYADGGDVAEAALGDRRNG